MYRRLAVSDMCKGCVFTRQQSVLLKYIWNQNCFVSGTSQYIATSVIKRFV